jgi:phage baseplate assembly protein W
MTRLADIHSLHWQPALGREGVVENLDDLHQAIQIILRTRKGSDPLRPEFGSDLHLYLDHPMPRARPHLVREAIGAIRRWEPRVSVERVEFSLVAEAHAALRVVWRVADGTLRMTEVRL